MVDRSERFFVKAGYHARAAPEYYDDAVTPTITYQPDVYPFAAHLARRHGVSRVIDLGCGTGDKLAALHPELEIVGVDFGANIEHCRQTHPAGEWIEWDLERPELLPLDREVAADAVVVCSDVIEHLVDPRPLLANLVAMLEYAPAAVISTPERDLVRGPDDPGPPANVAHVREWTLAEFQELLEWADLVPSAIGLTRSNDDHNLKRTIVAAVDNVFAHRPAPAPADFRVLAVMTTYNEADVIEPVICALAAEGVDVHLIDNHSTDGTYELADRLRGRGVVGLERYPAEPSGTYDWTALLARVEQVAAASGASWCIHHDADEVRRSPWAGTTVRDALWRVDRAGFSAVDHTVVEFHPVDDGHVAGTSPEAHLRHWSWGLKSGHFQQIKAWRNTGRRVLLAESGGHEAAFPGRRIAPFNFLLKHYPVRSQRHGDQKVLVDRIGRWAPEERARGWHTQYDHVSAGHRFLREPDQLATWDDETFHVEQLVERLARVGPPFDAARPPG